MEKIAFLDTEFTSLTRDAKLISLALVAPQGKEFYVELNEGWSLTDCSPFVHQIVLPQLDPARHGMTIREASNALLQFIDDLGPGWQIATDAPNWDWDFFCLLAHDQTGTWPRNISQMPLNSIALLGQWDIGIPDDEVPHHALLDARMCADLYQRGLKQYA